MAAAFKPQVAVLDIGLPIMDGYELATRLRAMAGLNGLQLIAVTGYGQESDQRRSETAGFDAHLIKPVSSDKLSCELSDLRWRPRMTRQPRRTTTGMATVEAATRSRPSR